MISNPCKWFANGGSFDDQVQFLHEGGKTLYHFSPDEEIHPSLDHWIPVNVVFFANSKEHAVEIIERMLKLRMWAQKEYEKYKGYAADYETHSVKINLPQLLLDNKDKWVITEAPTNQFYQVGWACNDTLL